LEVLRRARAHLVGVIMVHGVRDAFQPFGALRAKLDKSA
jgi:hypothetical protein